MKYIVHKRFHSTAICGEVNIPAMTECESNGVFITLDGKPLCCTTCENAHQFFAINDDGNGMERGKLTQEIQKTLAKNDAQHQERWDKVWDDPICRPYKRSDYDDYWLWNHEFFNADINDLRHIARLVGAKEEENVSRYQDRRH